MGCHGGLFWKARLIRRSGIRYHLGQQPARNRAPGFVGAGWEAVSEDGVWEAIQAWVDGNEGVDEDVLVVVDN